jgi:hypothetical protein
MLNAKPTLIVSWQEKVPKIYDECWRNEFKLIFYNALKINNEINQCALTWLLLNKGYRQNNNILSSLPYEIIIKVMDFVCPSNILLSSNFFNFITDILPKMDAFRKIYITMAKGDAALLANHTFWEENKKLSPVRFARKIQHKIQNQPDSVTTSAWKIACKHHDQCHSGNGELVNHLVNWYIKNDGIRNTIPNIISFFSSGYQDQETRIREEIKLSLT